MNLQKVVLKLHLANANNKLLGNWLNNYIMVRIH